MLAHVECENFKFNSKCRTLHRFCWGVSSFLLNYTRSR